MADVAIYHLTAKTVSRADGRSATAAAAYRAAERIVDLRTGEIHSYTRKGGVLNKGSQVLLPGGGTVERAALWNSVEAAHKRKDSVVAREIEIALPPELTREQRQELAESYAQTLSDRYGVAVDLALHAPSLKGDERNFHAHILMSACYVSPDGVMGKKCVELDPIHCKRAGIENAVEVQRKEWQDMCNAALEKAGHTARIDHRTLVAQGIEDRPAGSHLGPAVTEILRDGRHSDVADRVADEVREFMAEVQADAAIAEARASAQRELAALEQELAFELKNQEIENGIRAAAFRSIAVNVSAANQASAGTGANVEFASETFGRTRGNITAIVEARNNPEFHPDRIKKAVERWRFKSDFRTAFITVGNVVGRACKTLARAIEEVAKDFIQRAPAKSPEEQIKEFEELNIDFNNAQRAFREMCNIDYYPIPTKEKIKAVADLKIEVENKRKLREMAEELEAKAQKFNLLAPREQRRARQELPLLKERIDQSQQKIYELENTGRKQTSEGVEEQRVRVEELSAKLMALQPTVAPLLVLAAQKALELQQEKTVRRLVEWEYRLKGHSNPEEDADQRMEQFKAEPGKIAKLAALAPKRDAELTIFEQAKEAKQASESRNDDGGGGGSFKP